MNDEYQLLLQSDILFNMTNSPFLAKNSYWCYDLQPIYLIFPHKFTSCSNASAYLRIRTAFSHKVFKAVFFYPLLECLSSHQCLHCVISNLILTLVLKCSTENGIHQWCWVTCRASTLLPFSQSCARHDDTCSLQMQPGRHCCSAAAERRRSEI